MTKAVENDPILQAELDFALTGLSHIKHGLSFRSLDSTNDYAFTVEKMGCESGTVIIAAQQTLGRGRLKRAWHMAEGDIAMSIILRPPQVPNNWTLLSIMPALAVKAALTHLNITVALKWPNDIIILAGENEKKLNYFLNFRKLGGILVENVFCQNVLSACVIGIGLNVTPKDAFKDAVPHIGSVADQVPGISREACLEGILRELDQLISAIGSDGFEERIMASYSEACATIGEKVSVEMAGHRVCGLATKVLADGALVINDGQSDHIVLAGDVFFVR